MKSNENNYTLDGDFTKNCEVFIELILSYNKTHNITGVKNKEAIKVDIEDSIYPIIYLPSGIKKAIDIGSGAGFPGLILAMALPKIHFTLFEPIKKKSAFLHLAKTSLNLKNVDIISKRVEEIEAFSVDIICSRAVTKVDLLLKICKDFITCENTMLLYKGSSVSEEVNNLEDYKIYTNGNRNYLFIKTKGNK